MEQHERDSLEQEIARIGEKAKEFGLDFFDMRFEVCPADVLYTFGAYGMPTRFSHWSFGKAFHRMKMQYDYNLSRIYELVVNSNPCYAFLLNTNSLLQNKLIAAHVFAHSDFFKNNSRFQRTQRDMIESMSASSERIRKYEFLYGKAIVEQFLDAALSIAEQVDPYLRKAWNQAKEESPLPEKDILFFLIHHSKRLEEWQRDILSIIRNEMLYFWPQMETKIMNEGWASYWHLRILRELDLDPSESIEFARMHAAVTQPSMRTINPYLVGIKIFEDVERRWNEAGQGGREKIFEVRESESDVSFLRNYLTKELVEELDLYVYKRVKDDWQIVEKRRDVVRDGLVAALTHCGVPYIVVQDGDYNGNGELMLHHSYEGMELDPTYTEKTLEYLFRLWGRPVHLETVYEGAARIFTYDGRDHRHR